MGSPGRLAAALLAALLALGASDVAFRVTRERDRSPYVFTVPGARPPSAVASPEGRQLPFGVALSLGKIDVQARAEEVRAYERRRDAAVRGLLDTRQRAILARDEKAFLSVLDPTQKAFVARQRRLFAGIRQLEFSTWTYELVPGRHVEPREVEWQRYGGADVRLPFVTLGYTLRGFDPVPVRRQSVLTFVERDGRWLLGGDDDVEPDPERSRLVGATTIHDPWDAGEIAVARGRTSLVVGDPRDRARLPELAKAVDRAVGDVTKAWGAGWTRRAVVLVPREATLLRAVFPYGEDFDDVGAVAVPTGSGGGRVVVNPEQLEDADDAAFDYLLRHEVAHLAQFAAGHTAPSWLTEGLAEYVAKLPFRGVPTARLAPTLAAEARAGRLPTDVPLDVEFEENRPLHYDTSWVACRYLVDTYGVARVRALYERMAKLPSRLLAPQELSAAMSATLGVDEDTFLAGWRRQLRRQFA